MIKLRPILENLEITQIVSIDDENKSNPIERISDKQIDGYLPLVKLEREEEEFLYDSGMQLVSELQESGEAIAATILSKIEDYHQENEVPKSALLWLESTISEIKSQKLNYEKINDISEIMNLDKKNSLWILDKDMAGKDSIYHTIKMIKDGFVNNINIFMIFTHDQSMQSLNIEWQNRYDYLLEIGFEASEAQQLAYELYVICKPEESRKPEKAVFKEVVFNSIIGHTINAIFVNMKNAKYDVLNQFESFTKKVDFDRLRTFKYNVENEGEHNIYRLLNNVMNLMELQSYRTYMIQGVNYINVFKKLISNSKGNSQNEERFRTLELINKEYAWNQYQYIDVDINLGYEDPHFGDVFEVTLSEFYGQKFDVIDKKIIGVLITQSCDCIVRKDTGKRKKNLMELLLFEEKNSVELNNSSELYQNAIFLFNHKDNTPNSYIFKEKSIGMLHIDDAILDLCSLNQEGEAYILSDDILKSEIELKKPIEWNEKKFMFENLQEKRIVEDVPINTKLLEARYGIKYHSEEKKFDIKRLGRLSYNNAHIILNSYLSDVARIGKESPSTIKMQDDNE